MNSSKFVARLQQLDWLGLCLVSWVGPLAFDAWRPLTYATSLLFWLLPTFLLWPRFAALTDPGGRRRTAFAIAVAEIVILGLLLDFGFGRWILSFACEVPHQYLVCLRGVPIEEVFFYILGPIAILLVYVWNDEYWMPAYNPVRARIDFARSQQRIIVFSWAPLALGVALEVIGLAVKRHHPDGPIVPLYFTYLVILAFVPAIALFDRVSAFVNWRALGMTVLYLVVTSMIWEPDSGPAPRLVVGTQDSGDDGHLGRRLHEGRHPPLADRSRAGLDRCAILVRAHLRGDQNVALSPATR